jgi:hypothetical protein
MRILGASGKIADGRALLPLGYRLRVDPVTLGQRDQALLTMWYCSMDRHCRAGAPVQILSHSASFH